MFKLEMSVPAINLRLVYEYNSMDELIDGRIERIKQNSAWSGVRYTVL